MILPASLIRGETLILQVAVFNYMSQDIDNIDVTLVKTTSFAKFKNNESFAEKFTDDMVINIASIKSQTGRTVSFAISAVSLGLQILHVRANCSIAGDAEQKTILVKPEGISHIGNKALLIDLRNESRQNASIEISLPENLVNKSEACSVQIIGDLLGQAFNNLGKIISN